MFEVLGEGEFTQPARAVEGATTAFCSDPASVSNDEGIETE